jgi:Flp pilus assembly protein TadD
MPVEYGRNQLLRRLSLLLLMGVAGCTTTPVEGPRLAATGATSEAVAQGGVEQLVRMGQSSLASGDARTAIGLLEQAIARDPDSRDAALLLGYAQLAVGSPQDAGTAFGRVLRRNPADREASIGYAKAMLAIGRSEAALQHVQPLTRAAAGDVEALNLEGVALDLQGEHARAAEVYRLALAVRPDASDVQSNLGLSLALAGRHDEAIAVLRPLAEGYVSSPRSRQNLALAYGLAGQIAEAERWSRMDLSNADVENNLRYLQLMRGLMPGAVRSAGLQPDFARPALVETAPSPRLGAPPAVAVEPPPPAPPLSSTPAVAPPTPAVAPPQPLTVAPARSVPAADVRPASSAPSERLPAAVRPRPAFVSGAAAVAGVGVEVPEVGGWFVDLGQLPEADWRRLRDGHRAATAGLYRLAPGKDGEAPFIVGPFDTADEADAFCRRIADGVASCAAVRL